MALWRYTLEMPDGARVANVLAAGNHEAAKARAERNAANHGARLVGEIEVTDPRRGTL